MKKDIGLIEEKKETALSNNFKLKKKEQAEEELLQKIMKYCLEYKVNGSFNNPYKGFNISFEIKKWKEK